MLVRKPAVANQFYTGDPVALGRELSLLIPKTSHRRQVICAISPHAGYVYSGHVAGAVFGRIIVPERVIILGPNHTGYGSLAEIMTEGIWDMPLGKVPIDEELSKRILSNSSVLEAGYQAHIYEHSLEVQVPFLQYLQPDVKICPICLGPIDISSCLEVGKAIFRALSAIDEPALIVASTDMSHYIPADAAKKLDYLAISRILDLDPEGLYETVKQYGITMCGYIPATISIEASKLLGAARAELVKYANSGDVNGDYSRVVGYAGLVCY